LLLQLAEAYLALKNADHTAVFVTEAELRTTPIFEAGEATGKATLHTLRALQVTHSLYRTISCSAAPPAHLAHSTQPFYFLRVSV
jgi:hypothetical protein